MAATKVANWSPALWLRWALGQLPYRRAQASSPTTAPLARPLRLALGQPTTTPLARALGQPTTAPRGSATTMSAGAVTMSAGTVPFALQRPLWHWHVGRYGDVPALGATGTSQSGADVRIDGYSPDLIAPTSWLGVVEARISEPVLPDEYRRDIDGMAIWSGSMNARQMQR